MNRHWKLLREQPADNLGLGKEVDLQYPTRLGIPAIRPSRWFREGNVPQGMAAGWYVFYDEDGKYVRSVGHGDILIFMTQGLNVVQAAKCSNASESARTLRTDPGNLRA
jgi:hypothetical protein